MVPALLLTVTLVSVFVGLAFDVVVTRYATVATITYAVNQRVLLYRTHMYAVDIPIYTTNACTNNVMTMHDHMTCNTRIRHYHQYS